MSMRPWGIMKMSNMQAMEVPKGMKKENGIETIFEDVSKLRERAS